MVTLFGRAHCTTQTCINWAELLLRSCQSFIVPPLLLRDEHSIPVSACSRIQCEHLGPPAARYFTPALAVIICLMQLCLHAHVVMHTCRWQLQETLMSPNRAGPGSPEAAALHQREPTGDRHGHLSCPEVSAAHLQQLKTAVRQSTLGQTLVTVPETRQA